MKSSHLNTALPPVRTSWCGAFQRPHLGAPFSTFSFNAALEFLHTLWLSPLGWHPHKLILHLHHAGKKTREAAHSINLSGEPPAKRKPGCRRSRVDTLTQKLPPYPQMLLTDSPADRVWNEAREQTGRRFSIGSSHLSLGSVEPEGVARGGEAGLEPARGQWNHFNRWLGAVRGLIWDLDLTARRRGMGD